MTKEIERSGKTGRRSAARSSAKPVAKAGNRKAKSATRPSRLLDIARESRPKTTRPDSASRRDLPLQQTTARKLNRKLDAFPDRIDMRDWVYQPQLNPLPDQLVSCALVPEILDQGSEGACTGFALAAVINFLLGSRKLERRASPRMLYELARRYDEWPGESYEGSSARGAMKAWVRHGVCRRSSWPDDWHGSHHLDDNLAKEAMSAPGGAFYRVMHRQVRDMHSALLETGILYVTLMVHAGWERPGPLAVFVDIPAASGRKRRLKLPVIERSGRADGGHAVAIVGYTAQGFIIQNSWGRKWGANGFALLPYEDYMLHATDVWVAQLGVPVVADLWVDHGAADDTKGLNRAARIITLDEIRPFVIDVANNGELSDRGDYWTSESDLKRLFSETIPRTTAGWKKRRIMLYLHGGLNDEKETARRVIAFRDVFLANEIYPLHIMWETGWKEVIANIISDHFKAADLRARGGFSDFVSEARDRVLELTAAAPGSALWDEMKENAALASNRANQKGAMQLIVKYVKEVTSKLEPTRARDLELHVVGHSAGSIFFAHALTALSSLGLGFKTLQLMAPAMRMDLFEQLVLPAVATGTCPKPTVYVLSDTGELDDDVGPYGKSLLYLVSRAFEDRRDTPLLGMKYFIDRASKAVVDLFAGQVDGRPGLVVAGEFGAGGSTRSKAALGSISRSNSHGGFDNDPDTMNSVLVRILGVDPPRPFDQRDLQF